MNQSFLEQPAIKSRIDEYLAPRADGDIDLVAEVRNLMLRYGLGPKIEAAFDNNRFIIQARDKGSHVQRYLLNNYFVQQLMFASKPTTDERFCLVPDGDVRDWLRLFEQKVLPFIVDNDLPRVI